MNTFLEEHWILSIILTILLGAIGSGIWDSVLKPYGKKAGSIFFTAITFNAERARNKIFKNASLGHHELPSLYLLFIFFILATVFLISSSLKVYTIVYMPPVYESDIKECLDKEKSNRKNCTREIIKKELLPTVHIFTLISIFMSVIILYRFSAINRTNLVITYYNQCLKTIRPYISNEEYYSFESKFSIVTSKEEYDDIINAFENIANNNEISLPESYI